MSVFFRKFSMNYPISHSHSNDTETETSFDIETIELRRIIENVSVELAVQKDILGYCCMELMGIAKPLQQAIPLIDIGVPEAIDDYVYDLGEKFYEIFARRELEKDVEAAYVVIKLNFEVPMLRQTPQGIRIRRFGSRCYGSCLSNNPTPGKKRYLYYDAERFGEYDSDYCLFYITPASRISSRVCFLLNNRLFY